MAPSIDFSTIQSLDPIPTGSYHAEIESATVGVSKANHPKIDLRWTVIGGEFDGRSVFDSMSFHPKALWRAKQSLQALGFGSDFSGEIEADDLVGRTATIVVTKEPESTDPATGETYPERNRVSKVKPAGATVAGLLG